MTQQLSPDLLTMIRCPVTQSNLVEVSPERVVELNAKIKGRKLVNRIGQLVDRPLDGGLVNEQGTLLMPVRSGIVTLIADEAILLDD
jgi:uncharacterized protein YbaR (Trm112 family)